jgi:hypothetical protein
MPRFSNIKDTPIEINKMSPLAGTRYRESGLVLRHIAASHIYRDDMLSGQKPYSVNVVFTGEEL